MSETPKAHVYEPTTDGGHCAACGHHLEASWHYVPGKDLVALQREIGRLSRERLRGMGREQALRVPMVLIPERPDCGDTARRELWDRIDAARVVLMNKPLPWSDVNMGRLGAFSTVLDWMGPR